jgi:hypothetical protein
LVRILKWGGRGREGKRGICFIQKFKPEKLKKLHDEKETNPERENFLLANAIIRLFEPPRLRAYWSDD